jgi:pimeloyl-ACP methyl ester carboxylesterase
MAVQVADPTTGILRSLDFGPMHLAAALRLYSYSDETASLLPFLINEAAQERPQSLAAQALLVARDLSEQMANGMHNAVVCTEDVPFFTEQALQDPAIAQSYLGRDFVEMLQTVCSVWPRGMIDLNLHAPLNSDVPALLLSGANDPVTPAAYGERAARGYRRGTHVIVPGQGHGQLNNPCIAQVITKFINTLPGNLNLDCVDKQAAASFMLNASSPGP